MQRSLRAGGERAQSRSMKVARNGSGHAGAVIYGKLSNTPQNEPVVEGKHLEPHDARDLQTRRSQVHDGHISRPGVMRLRRDHRENRVTRLVESLVAEDQRRAMLGLSKKGNGTTTTHHFSQ